MSVSLGQDLFHFPGRGCGGRSKSAAPWMTFRSLIGVLCRADHGRQPHEDHHKSDDRPGGCDLDGIGYINSRRFPSLILCTAVGNGEDGR
jgi:hypothetical protein